MAVALLLQFTWMLVHIIRQRREIRALQRRFEALGTELGLVKAKAHTTRRPRPSVPFDIDPSVAAAMLPDGFMAELNVDYPRRRRLTVEQFSPSWI